MITYSHEVEANRRALELLRPEWQDEYRKMVDPQLRGYRYPLTGLAAAIGIPLVAATASRALLRRLMQQEAIPGADADQRALQSLAEADRAALTSLSDRKLRRLTHAGAWKSDEARQAAGAGSILSGALMAGLGARGRIGRVRALLPQRLFLGGMGLGAATSGAQLLADRTSIEETSRRQAAARALLSDRDR